MIYLFVCLIILITKVGINLSYDTRCDTIIKEMVYDMYRDMTTVSFNVLNYCNEFLIRNGIGDIASNKY